MLIRALDQAIRWNAQCVVVFSTVSSSRFDRYLGLCPRLSTITGTREGSLRVADPETHALEPCASIPRDMLSKKVRTFLITAQRDGYEWAWADTCCIDKTSSANLTEAINSMFRYYALSDVCYVYLHDVSGACFIGKEDCRLDQEFGTSKWHTRG